MNKTTHNDFRILSYSTGTFAAQEKVLFFFWSTIAVTDTIAEAKQEIKDIIDSRKRVTVTAVTFYED